jgi:hypothetical protein
MGIKRTKHAVYDLKYHDGYFVRSVGDEVTADVIRKYIQYQTHEDNSSQLNMFK